MDDPTVDSDKFSLLGDELISNISRPSLVSFSSEDSLNQEEVERNIAFISPDIKSKMSSLKTSTSEHSSSHENTGNEDDIIKKPTKFTSTKRYSLSTLNDVQSAYNMNKFSSMLDISRMLYSPPSLRRDSYMYSNETLQSTSIATTKSKDSGFQRSTSCTSLTTTGSKKYDHVQSKVKQYIQTIKQTEAVRKMQKRLENKVYREVIEGSNLESPESSPVSSADTTVSQTDLINKVKELEEELKEKECVIEQLEKNQSELRLKYAAAENRIDDLRIRISQHEEPMKSYISDERVAELLLSSARNSRRQFDSSLVKRFSSDRREGALVHDDVPQVLRSKVDPYGRETPQSTNKSFVNSPLRPDAEVSRSSSFKDVAKPTYPLAKSSSNIERVRPMSKLVESDIKNIPYEKNSFAKVEQWQRSLPKLNDAYDERFASAYCSPTNDTFYMCDDSLDENQLKKSRRYQKNKDADKKRYRQSYPVGCKCEKFKKCRSKEDLCTSSPTQTQPAADRRKFRRTVSFASYEDSLTSSMYDDGESSSDDSTEMTNGTPVRRESYKRYKQRKLQEKLKKDGHEFMLAWNDIKKAKSATNIHHRGDVISSSPIQIRHKRVMDFQPASGSISGCDHPCTDRKHCSKVLSKKYRKLDDCSKIATSLGCHPLVNVSPARGCRPSASCDIVDDAKVASYLSHSKSFDDRCRRGCETRDRGHRVDKVECSCLVALENLNLRDHRVLAKLAEQSYMYPRKLKKEKEATLPGVSRLCLLHK